MKINLKNQNYYPDFLWLHSAYHQALRQKLNALSYQEQWCPPLSPAPCFETHVHPLQIFSPQKQKKLELYLHTSPEFVLKNFLCQTNSAQGIYNLNYVFRDDALSPIHRKQFILLEFYRKENKLELFLDDLKMLLLEIQAFLTSHNVEHLSFKTVEQISVDELFLKYLGFSILDFISEDELYKKIQLDYPQHATPHKLPFDDLFNLLWLNYIEPKLSQYPALLVNEYPAPLSLLAKKTSPQAKTARRFELFIAGVEIANGYQEETHFAENLKAIEEHLKSKQKLYNYQLHSPDFFLRELKKQSLPQAFGIALGTERLLQTLTQAKSAFIDFYN